MASATATMSITPTFLVSGMAVQIADTLHLDTGQLGLAVAGFFGATALTAEPLGRVVAKVGARIALIAVMAVDVVVLAVLATCTSIAVLMVALIVAGVANGAVHPASNVLLAAGVRGRLGLALGIKQSSMPAAALVGGLAVPLVALTAGWRWGFAACAITAAGLLLWVCTLDSRRDQPVEPALTAAEARRRSRIVWRPWMLIAAAGCGTAAGTSLGVFLVDAGVGSGHLSPGAAGLLAAASGLFAVVNRIGLGWAADRGRVPHALTTSGILLILGAAGFGLMALGSITSFVIGSIVALGIGFAWAGLLHLAVIGAPAANAARTTGTLMTGMAAGSCLGPLTLGLVISSWGYDTAWVIAAGLSLLAAGLVIAAGRPGGRSTAQPSGGGDHGIASEPEGIR